jgi:hypothetical protein
MDACQKRWAPSKALGSCSYYIRHTVASNLLLNPHFDGDFFSQLNMKYIQLSLGILVVVLCIMFAIVLLLTDLFPMESWRKTTLVLVFLSYGVFRGWRVYNAFKINK